MKKKHIAVIGDSILDKYTFYNSTRLSPEAPVPVITKDSIKYFPGGAALTASKLNSLGFNVDLFTQVGSDENGERLLKILKELKVYTFNKKNYSTILKNRLIVNKKYYLREDYEKKNSPNSGSFINEFKSLMKKYDSVVFVDYDKGFLNESNFQKIKKISIDEGKLLFMDPHPKNIKSFENINYLKPNLNEAKKITNLNKINSILKLLSQQFNTIPVITLGSEGSVSIENNKVIRSKVFSSDLIDPSGSGDIFFAHFISSILQEQNLYTAINYASKNATKNINNFGYDLN
jgi:rfaE bifunctional protein kinase chain/domain